MPHDLRCHCVQLLIGNEKANFIEKVLQKSPSRSNDAGRDTLHEVEGRLAAPCPVCLQSLERSFIKTYTRLLFFITENFDAIPRSPRNGKLLYQVLRIADSHGCHELSSRLDYALDAPLFAMISVVARAVSDWKDGSHKAFTFEAEPLFVTRVQGVASHDDRKDVSQLLEWHSFGRVKAFQNCVASRNDGSSVFEIKKRESQIGRSTIGTLTRDFSIPYCGQDRRCPPGRSLASMMIPKSPPSDFTLSFSRTAENYRKIRSLPSTTRWTKTMTGRVACR